MEKELEKPSEEIQRLLKSVVDHFDAEDRSVRERQIRLWKKLKYMWDGFTRVWWSETAHDWRVYDEIYNENDASAYDKPINVFKAYLEVIIAALSVSVPPVTCTPDDAENAFDIETAKAGDKIAELIYKHNDAVLLWLHALFIHCTEGLVAAYHYTDTDKKYGEAEVDEYGDVESSYEETVCPNCFNPLQEFVGEQAFCVECEQFVEPKVEITNTTEFQIVGKTKQAKSKQCIEVYGGLFVKTPVYAMRQSDCPYLIFAYETHYANTIERYPSLAGKFTGDTKVGPTTGGMFDSYERWGRLSTQYLGEYPINNVTCRNVWLRPAAFNVLNPEDATKLKDKYPLGAKVVFVDELFAEACECELDKNWTLTHNPLSDYLQHDPLGNTLVSIQEITNNMISLILQTIEHGIPQTFADPSVLNFNQYNQTEATPGMIFPAKAPIGKSINDGFYEVKTALLSGEVEPFMQRIQEAGQFVSGALPSLFGGAAPNSSKTAAQYAMSRAQALQRLQTPWKVLTFWWKDIFGKTIQAYIENVIEDERFTKPDAQGGYVNVFIRKAELQGKIGNIELEASEQLPITWAQTKEALMSFLTTMPDAITYLSSPENLPILKKALGVPDFVMPGTDDRDKQYEEIQVLIVSEPMMDMDPLTGMPIEQPSVPIEPDVDNHMIEAETCRHWLVSSTGREAKVMNPMGYKNVLLHMKAHQMAAQMAQMQQMAQQEPQGQEATNESK
jgi:hypothetical protein